MKKNIFFPLGQRAGYRAHPPNEDLENLKCSILRKPTLGKITGPEPSGRTPRGPLKMVGCPDPLLGAGSGRLLLFQILPLLGVVGRPTILGTHGSTQ